MTPIAAGSRRVRSLMNPKSAARVIRSAKMAKRLMRGDCSGLLGCRIAASPRHRLLIPTLPRSPLHVHHLLHRFPGLPGLGAPAPGPPPRAGRRGGLPGAAEVPRPGPRPGRRDRGRGPRFRGTGPSGGGGHHRAGARAGGSGGRGRHRDLPPGGDLRSVGAPRPGDEGERRRHPEPAALRRRPGRPGALPVRLHLLRLRSLRRRLRRGRPGEGAGVQQLLRGDEVPGRGAGPGVDGEGAAGHRLPAVDRGGGQPHRCHRQVRRPVLRDPLAPQAAGGGGDAGGGRSPAHPPQRGAVGLRDLGDRPPVRDRRIARA